MSDLKFKAIAREGKGKFAAKRARAEGQLPANVYGRGEKGHIVMVNYREINMLYQRTIGKNALLTMQLEGQSDQIVMFKEVQRDPVKDKFLHVDFYHVDPAHPIKLKIPVVLTGSAKGVKELGGILDQPSRFLAVRCLPKDIPTEIKVDVSNLGIDESILLQDITPPAGVRFFGNAHTVLAHVSQVEEEKAPVAAAGAESAAGTPEVIKEKKPEEGAAAAPAAGAAAPAKDAKDAKAAPAKK